MRFFLADGMWDSALARTASVRTYHRRTVGVRTSFVLFKARKHSRECLYTKSGVETLVAGQEVVPEGP